jgi:hypothetical protein
MATAALNVKWPLALERMAGGRATRSINGKARGGGAGACYHIREPGNSMILG